MNPEITKLITDLAAKLGTTADHLWGVLVKQAPIESFSSIAAYLFTILVIAAVIYYGYRAVKWGMENDDEVKEGGWVLIGAACLALFIWSVCLSLDLGRIVSGFLNPEYWALKQILK